MSLSWCEMQMSVRLSENVSWHLPITRTASGHKTSICVADRAPVRGTYSPVPKCTYNTQFGSCTVKWHWISSAGNYASVVGSGQSHTRHVRCWHEWNQTKLATCNLSSAVGAKSNAHKSIRSALQFSATGEHIGSDKQSKSWTPKAASARATCTPLWHWYLVPAYRVRRENSLK